MTDPTGDELLAVLADCDERIKAAEAEYAEALAQLQEICEHKVLLEAPWESSASGLFPASEALRICETCGLEEEGPCFWVLKGRAYPVQRSGEGGIYASRRRGPRHLVRRSNR